MNAEEFVKAVLDGIGGSKLRIMSRLRSMDVGAVDTRTGQRLSVVGVAVRGDSIVLEVEVKPCAR